MQAKDFLCKGRLLHHPVRPYLFRKIRDDVLEDQQATGAIPLWLTLEREPLFQGKVVESDPEEQHCSPGHCGRAEVTEFRWLHPESLHQRRLRRRLDR